MKKTRGLITLAITLCLLIGAMGIFALTAGASGGESTYVASVTDLESNDLGSFTTFEAAADAAKQQGGGRITLLSDYYFDFTYYFCEGSYYLDLNGKKLICDNATVLGIEDTASLTIDDSGSGGTIRTNESTSQAIYSYGDLTVKNGNIYGAMGIFSFIGDNKYPATLTINGGNITGTVYSTIETRGTAIINGGTFDARGALTGISNHGDLTINYCELTASYGLHNYDGGKARINGGYLNGTKGPAIYMLGGEVTVSGGVLIGEDDGHSAQPMVAHVNTGSTLNIEGGIYPEGFFTNEDPSALLSDKYRFHGENLRAIDTDGVDGVIEGLCYVYPADAVAAVVDSSFGLIQGFDSVNDALTYASEQANGESGFVIVLRDTDEDITDVPFNISLDAGANVLSGDVVNHGKLKSGVFTGNITNYGDIVSGSFYGSVRLMDGASMEISNEHGNTHVDCELIIESGANVRCDNTSTYGDNFRVTDNGGVINCEAHIGEATCISDAICLLCDTKFGDRDPDAHKAKTEATCVALAVCKYCEEEFGEKAEHIYNDGGDCIVEGCGVRATVKLNDKFYEDYFVAISYAKDGDTVSAVRDFELPNMLIPAGVIFNSGAYTVTLTEGDLTVFGTLYFGMFVLNNDRTIGVEPGGVIINGIFINEVRNSGTILGGAFADCAIFNNSTGYINNEGNVIVSGTTTVENLGGTIECHYHYGGTATCHDLSVCRLCGSEYGVLDPDAHTSIVNDDGVEPTCTQTGLTAGTHCVACEEIIVAQEEIPALTHDIVVDKGFAPTCTEAGLTDGQHCTRCDGAAVSQETIPPLNHDIVVDEGRAPTCTEAGLTEGKHCTRCDSATVIQQAVAALGHSDENNDRLCDNGCGTELPRERLSGGAIAGIAVSSTATAGIGGFSIFWFAIKKKKLSDLLGLFKKS